MPERGETVHNGVGETSKLCAPLSRATKTLCRLQFTPPGCTAATVQHNMSFSFLWANHQHSRFNFAVADKQQTYPCTAPRLTTCVFSWYNMVQQDVLQLREAQQLVKGQPSLTTAQVEQHSIKSIIGRSQDLQQQ